MAKRYEKKKKKHSIIIYSVITAFLICTVFLSMVASFYMRAEEEAYETLHMQTKQIKDDLILQLKSDRENLSTMANFAAKLYADGKTYDRMFDSFKPIGLFSRIGILTPECMFITKDGTVDLSDKMSFEEEAALDEHITGRTYSYSVPDEQVVRSSVPFKVDGKIVGIMYGIIQISTINDKYTAMAKELDAQLFVYGKNSGKFIIDTIDWPPGELSQLKDRKYKDGSSYDLLENTENGYLSYRSIFRNEDLYVHYSTISDFDWGILLCRYESQVFEEAHSVVATLAKTFVMLVVVIFCYIALLFGIEKRKTSATSHASEIRKLLLDINQQHTNVDKALSSIREFSHARTAFFVDSNEENYYNISPAEKVRLLPLEYRQHINNQLFRYAEMLSDTNKSSALVMRIVPNKHLVKTNKEFYDFMKKHNLREISFATITDNTNHTTILGVVNPKESVSSRLLLEDIVVCFSIAIYNKKHLNNTEIAATTDSLTGALNRVSYKKDIMDINDAKPRNFACVYIDVNELHIINNKFGHAAGDEMLIYIVNSLKDVFNGYSVYRMGGDEFLVFCENLSQEAVKNSIDLFMNQLKETTYKVAIGMSYRTQCTDCEEMVREAEVRMYEAKSQYYQNKEQKSVSNDVDNYVHTKTGITEIDALISILKDHYNGIYRVSLKTDNAHRILMPAYLGYNEREEHFTKLFTKYVEEIVHPDFHRSVMSFLNYDALSRQLSDGLIPKISYKKVNSETVSLSVYNLEDNKSEIDETLWVFAKE